MKNLPEYDNVEREDGESKARYRIAMRQYEADMAYSRASKVPIIDHTFVPATFRGRKVGERTIRQTAEDARREGIVIIPRCSLVKVQIGPHPNWQDILSKYSISQSWIPIGC